MLVARIEEDFQLAVSQAPLPALPERGALLKVIGCGLCGSDLDKLIHQKSPPGSILGHEVVGIIEALNDDHPSGWRLGDRIMVSHHVPCGVCHYCRNDSESMCRQFKQTNLDPGGFSQYIALSEGHLRHTAFKTPPEISSAEASCVEPLACVLRGIRRAGVSFNGAVAVVGLGFIGMMAAQVYQNDGYAVYGVDVDPARLAFAKTQGFVTDAFHSVQDRETLNDTLQQHLPVGRVDTVFLTAVNAKTLALAGDLVRDGGNIVIFTSAPPDTTLDPSQLYFREINLITSYSPALQDLDAAAQMIFRRKIDVKTLVSHCLPLPEIQQAVELYRSAQAMKVFITMGEPDA